MSAVASVRRSTGILRYAHGASSFKIVQFTDLHFCANEVSNARTVEVMRGVLSAESPDLVVFSGDMVSGDDWERAGRQPGWVAAQWRAALAPLNGSVPYAVALGNHDVRGNLDAAQLLAVDLAQSNSHTQAAGGPSPFTYTLEVSGEGQVPRRLWFLNSGDARCEGHRPWGCVPRDDLAWAAAQPPSAHALAFIHIPLPQLRPALLREPAGAMREPVSCPSIDTGVADWANGNGVAAAFFGHDHRNDFQGLYGDTLLAYGRCSGYGGYGPADLQRGARVILLRGNATETWIRQEDGSVVLFGNRSFDVQLPPPQREAWVLAALALSVLMLTLLLADGARNLWLWRQRCAVAVHKPARHPKKSNNGLLKLELEQLLVASA
jgi:hypothetical protein